MMNYGSVFSESCKYNWCLAHRRWRALARGRPSICASRRASRDAILRAASPRLSGHHRERVGSSIDDGKPRHQWPARRGSPAVKGDCLLGVLAPRIARRAAHPAPRIDGSARVSPRRSKPPGKRSRSSTDEDLIAMRNTLPYQDLRVDFDRRLKPRVARDRPWRTSIFPMPRSVTVRRSALSPKSRNLDAGTCKKCLGQRSSDGRFIAPWLVAHLWPSQHRCEARARRSRRPGKHPTILLTSGAAPRLPSAPSRARRLRKKILFFFSRGG